MNKPALNCLFLLAAFFMVFLYACKNDKTQGKDSFTISGKISNMQQGTIYLEKLSPEGITITDSASVNADGTFLLEETLKTPAFYRVRLQTDFITLLLDSGPGIHLTGDANHLSETYTVSGSSSSALLKTFNQAIQQADNSMDSLQEEYSKVRPGSEKESAPAQEKVRLSFEQLEKEKHNFVQHFIASNNNALVLLAAINYLNADLDFPYYLKTDSLLQKELPQSAYTKDFHAHMGNLRSLAIGAKVPNIILSNPQGKQIALSSLKGKIVLLDFWASWCAPCRKESPVLVTIYKKFHAKGFEIYSISLDKEPGPWLKAIEEDHLTWVHVSDLKFWDSAAAKSYGVQSIPFTILLNEQDIIIGKALRGQALEAKLEELFSRQ
jgi:peroxiredoxin